MPLLRGVLATVFLVIAALASPGEIEILIRTYPRDASLWLAADDPWDEPGQAINPDTVSDGYRVYKIDDSTRAIFIRADGYRDRALFLDGHARSVALDVRLERLGGPLELVGDVPTGSAPKSVAFTNNRELVVPLLRDGGADRLRIDSDGIRRIGRLRPPERWADAHGFVEALVLPDRGEVLISQMTTDTVHAFGIEDGSYLRTLASGGSWPKVLATGIDQQKIWVSNWASGTITEIDYLTGELLMDVAVSGTPRGIALDPDRRHIWVGIFSTGDIEVYDRRTGRRTAVVDLPAGAARHVVFGDEGRVYFTDMFRGSVGLVDGLRGRLVREVQLGSNLNTLVYDPVGRYLFVSERGVNNAESYLLPGPSFGRIFVLDARTLQTVQVVWGQNQPTGLAVSPDGRFLAASDFLDDNLSVYRIDDEYR